MSTYTDVAFTSRQPDTVTATKLNKLRDDLSVAIGSGGGGVGPPGPAGPAGPPGATGQPAWTLSTAGFTVPAIGASVTVSVADTSWVSVGEILWIQNAGGTGIAGALQVTAKTATSLTLKNIDTTALVVFTRTIDGLVPQPGGSTTTRYLREDATWVSPSGGLITADTAIQVQEDFCNNSTSVAPSGWISAVNGAAVAFNVNVGCDATNKGAGVVSMTCGTSGVNRSTLTYGVSVSDGNHDHFFPGLGILDLRFRVWLAAIYSSSSNYSIVRCGLITDDGTGTIRGGIYFEYNYAQGSGNWIATTASAGVLTRNASTTAVVAAQWMNLRILTDATWANASFYVNGTLAKSISGFTKPVNSMPINFYHAFGAGTGLATFYVDYAYLNYSYSRGSW